MKKKIVEGNVGVIILKDSTDYAKSMALKDEKVARMDKDLVEFLMDDTERLKGDQFLSLMKDKGLNTYGLFDYKKLAIEWVKEGEILDVSMIPSET
ncbi:hypothetical protein [Enterococcus faecium]|uniref:hypothetical protein n=1 Tax=Enterococcus faecium TaxID=1352 RepID=UPI000667446C|nr:hypothetical protein [Enterococcus faecium]AOM20759.1 hypothetical protein AL015_15780 [Enterococcus faecium]AOM32704.1 hypothetical protein AL020_15045 [Enterococcus faecium]AOM35772.1 hypothetical protein AL021_15240 [Enterococcus faecium]AOM39095.1 hypothetical protein AL024_15595 [Enterococcus faecium]KAF3382161.1 hypothetical protein BXA52_00230 [Enterococcus faecium]